MKRLVVEMTLTLARPRRLRGRRGARRAFLQLSAPQSPRAPICTSKAPSAGKQQQFSSPGGCGAKDPRGSGQRRGKVDKTKAFTGLP